MSPSPSQETNRPQYRGRLGTSKRRILPPLQKLPFSPEPTATAFVGADNHCIVALLLPLLFAALLISTKALSAADDNLEQGFANPPAAAKPSVYWWWLFNRIDKKGITRDLEQFKAKGIGGVNLICTGGYAGDHAMPGVKFLGPEWRELFRHAVKEANRLNIEIGFNMAGGWVMMGPWVAQQDAMKKIVQSELKLKGPQKFSGSLPQPDTVDGYYRDVVVQAFRSRDKTAPIDPKEIIDITDRWRADSNFQWDVPDGDWTILRTGYTLTGSKWQPYPLGDTFPGGAGYQIDYMNATSLGNYYNYLGKIALDEAKKAGGRLAYLWADSWESGKLTWTQDFAAEFRKFRGYDPTPYLPALHGHTVVNADVTARFRADFDRTIADCVAENFYGRFARLCHESGVEMRSEAAGPGDNPPIDALRNLGRCDVPAGEFWVNGHFNSAGGWNSHPGLRGNLKQTASAAHVYGKHIAQAEAFTQQEPDRTHWSLGPADLKPYGDNAYCEGINFFMLHQATCQLSTDRRPGYEFCAGQHWNPSITWWDQSAAFFSYVARCQYLLQQGLFVGDVCYYLGEDPPVVAPFKQYDPTLRGYDGDYCNAEVLLTRMSVKNGRIVLPDGMSYRVLVLQNCTSTSREVCDVIGGSVQQTISSTPSKAMSLEVLLKIWQLVHDGATVVGPRPEKAAGLNAYPKCDRRVKTLAAHIWGDCDGKTHTEHAYGKGRVIWGKPLGDVLRADGIKPDFVYSDQPNEPADDVVLDFIHRAAGGTDIYFVSNRKNRPETRSCTFRVAGRQPEIWDPVSGRMRDAGAFKQADGCTTLPLEFAPFESYFVVFRKPIAAAVAGKAARNFPKLSSAQEISGPWTVQFDPRWGGPASVQFPELVSWTKRPEPGIKYCSGKATYRKTFDVDRKPQTQPRDSSKLFLDLGRVQHVAEVRLNGKRLGVLWTAPWRVEITDAVRPSNNVLEIDVVNLWVNRVVGDLNLPKEKRVTETHDVFRFGMVRPTTPLLDSGLLGPVTLQQEVKKTPVILDTDIGDDIDDTWALAMLLKCPQFDVKLITTTCGKNVYRAKLIAKLLAAANCTDIPIGLGTGGSDGTGPQQPWVKDFDLAAYKGKVHKDGVQALIDAIKTSPTPMAILSIGPSHTVAAALDRDPSIAAKAVFVGMQGSVYKGYDGGRPAPEYNVKANVPAAQKAMSAPWQQAVITPLDTCGTIALSGQRFQKLTASNDPLVKALIETYRIWANNDKVDASTTLFDTVAVYLALPGPKPLLEMKELRIKVTADGMTAVDPAGAKMSVATEWKNLDAFRDLLLKTLLSN